MKKLSKKEGMKVIALTWTLFLEKDENFWANPYIERQLRYRCIFRRSKDSNKKLVVWFHLSDEEKENFPDLSPLPENIYFFGAFNHGPVTQIKSYGKIIEMTDDEKKIYTQSIADRLKGKNIGDKLPIEPGKGEKKDIREMIKAGNFYCFTPSSYEYYTVERN